MDTENKTQSYSTWGDKLLQHTDVLYNMQFNKKVIPITVQLAPVEACESKCPFCSVDNRPIRSKMTYLEIETTLRYFKDLGAKSLEITGGGNPLLWRDGSKDINDIIGLAYDMGFKIGIITNSSHPGKVISTDVYDKISWLRISLIRLDEGVAPEDYYFGEFPLNKMGFSYIIYGDEDSPKRTTHESIEKISSLVSLYPDIKFVRIAGDCLIKGNNQEVKSSYTKVLQAIDKYDKFFIKDIGEDDGPYTEGCYIGGIRPYIAPHPDGGDYQVYICTSHVLNTQTYDLDYSLGSIKDIPSIWEKMSHNLETLGYPYEIKGNRGSCWTKSCNYCFYKFNNKILHTVCTEMPDKDFP